MGSVRDRNGGRNLIDSISIQPTAKKKMNGEIDRENRVGRVPEKREGTEECKEERRAVSVFFFFF